MQLPYHEIPRTTPPNRCRLVAISLSLEGEGWGEGEFAGSELAEG